MVTASPAFPERAVTLTDASNRTRSLRDRLVSGSLYAFLTVVITQSFALATSILFARLLGAAGLGVLAVYVQVSSLVMAFVGLGLSVPTAKFVAELRTRSREELGDFVSTVFTITLVSAAMTSVASFALAEFIGLTVYASNDLVLMIRLSSVFLIVNAISYFSGAVLQGLQAIRTLSIISLIVEGLTVPITFGSLALFGLVGASVAGVILVAILACLTYGHARKILARERVTIRLRFSAREAKRLALFTAPLVASTLILHFAFLAQTTVVALGLGYDDAGQFKVASILYRVLLFIPSAIGIPLLPMASELYATRTPERTRRNLTTLLRVACFVGVPIATAVGFAAGPIIVTLYGPEYAVSAQLAFLLAISGFAEIASAVAVNFILGEGRTKALLTSDIIHAVIVVLSTSYFVGTLGLLGLGYAFIVSSTTHAIAVLSVLAFCGGLDSRKTVPMLLFAALGLALAALLFFNGAPYDVPWMGALLILGYGSSAWVLMGKEDRRAMSGVVTDLVSKLRAG